MKESSKNRTEYQKFLYSLFVKYRIESPDESWSNSVWKVIVKNRLSDFALENFYKELSEFNIKNPSDENWTYKNNEKLEEIEEKKKREKSESHLAWNAEVEIAYAIGKKKRIADAKKAEKEPITDAKKVEEFKECPYCAEDIKFAAKKCKHCGEFLEDEIDEPVPYDGWTPQNGILNQRQPALSKIRTKSVTNTNEIGFVGKVFIGTVVVIVTTWFVYYVALSILFS